MEHKDIFISYSRVDEYSVAKIVSFLKRKGYSIWIDKTGIETGEQFKNVIVEAITNCNIFIFISSESSNSSEWTEKEIGVAVAYHKKIIPIKLDKAPYNKSVLLDLVNLNYINYWDVKHRREQLEHLSETINQFLPGNDTRQKKETHAKAVFPTFKRMFSSAGIKIKNLAKNYRYLCLGLLALIVTIFIAGLSFIENHTYYKKYIIPQQFGRLNDIKGNDIAKMVSLYDVCIDPTISRDISDIRDFCYLLTQYSQDFPVYNTLETIKTHKYDNIRYLPLLRNINKEECDSIKNWPFFWKLSRAIIFHEVPSIYYPYGVLANRTIGTLRLGILGRYGQEIEGKSGFKEVRILNVRNNKHIKELNSVPPEDGHIVTSTLDMDLQEIADKVLRTNISKDTNICSAALVLMDVSTGALLSMVNLGRGCNDSLFREQYNYAIGERFEPGTLWSGVSLATSATNSDLSRNPNDQGDYYPQMPDIRKYVTHRSDLYIPTLKRIYSTKRNISYREGIATANSYSMSNLVMRSYEGRLYTYIDKIKALHVCDSIPIEIAGARKTYIGMPVFSEDYNAYLATLGAGYGIATTALNLLTFYNSIANGCLVYPYLIENVSTRQGTMLFSHKKIGINNFEKDDSDDTYSITDTLCSVMEYAAQRVPVLKNAKYKMGTIYGESLSVGSNNNPDDKYLNNKGQSNRQAGCYCYFPSDAPKYSAFCIVFTNKTEKEYLGKDIPCNVIGELADMIYEKTSLYNNKYHRMR